MSLYAAAFVFECSRGHEDKTKEPIQLCPQTFRYTERAGSECRIQSAELQCIIVPQYDKEILLGDFAATPKSNPC